QLTRANRRDFRADKARLDSSAAAPTLVHLDFVACSNVPSQLDRKNRADRAIRDRNRPHAPEAQPTPMQPVATRNRRAAPGRIASLPNLRRDVPGQRGAMRKENDRNPEWKPAESPRAIDRS